MMQLVKDMAFLVNHLMDERGAGSKHVEPQENPRWFMEQWEQFRALVNTREPKPASPEFLKVQDRVLQLMVAEPGITEADELARTASDPRLSIWRGDITALRCDAIVNAANSALLGCCIPGHLCIANAMTALSGAVLAQYQRSADINLGTGMVVIGLASLIIGETLFGRGGMWVKAVAAVADSVIYRFIIALALRANVPSECLKLISAVIVALAIAAPALKAKADFRRRRANAQKGGARHA